MLFIVFGENHVFANYNPTKNDQNTLDFFRVKLTQIINNDLKEGKKIILRLKAGLARFDEHTQVGYLLRELETHMKSEIAYLDPHFIITYTQKKATDVLDTLGYEYEIFDNKNSTGVILLMIPEIHGNKAILNTSNILLQELNNKKLLDIVFTEGIPWGYELDAGYRRNEACAEPIMIGSIVAECDNIKYQKQVTTVWADNAELLNQQFALMNEQMSGKNGATDGVSIIMELIYQLLYLEQYTLKEVMLVASECPTAEQPGHQECQKIANLTTQRSRAWMKFIEEHDHNNTTGLVALVWWGGHTKDITKYLENYDFSRLIISYGESGRQYFETDAKHAVVLYFMNQMPDTFFPALREFQAEIDKGHVKLSDQERQIYETYFIPILP